MTKFHIPGASIAVLRRGTIIHRKGYGLANLEHQIAARPDASYYIASLTKMFTASDLTVILLTNAEQGNYATVPNLAREIALIYLAK